MLPLADERRRTLAAALILFIAALALRLIYVWDLQASPLAQSPMLDELYHVDWARRLAAGDWIGDSVFFRAPLYPYLLGVILKAFGGSLTAARVVQAVYGALTPVVVYFLGRRLSDERGGIVAASVAAAYPFLMYFDNELLITSLIVLLDALLVLALLRADEHPSWLRWLGAGALLGLSSIARPNVLVFLPFVLFWARRSARSETAPSGGVSCRVTLVHCAGPWRTALLRFAFFALGAVLVVSPVTLRNYLIGKDFVPIASQGGVNFYIGNNARADGTSAVLPELGEAWEYDDAIRMAERDEGRPLKPSGVSAYWYGRGREFVLGSPGLAAGLYLKKATLLLDSFELANNKDIYFFGEMSPLFRVLRWLGFGVVAPLSLLGVWATRRRRRELTLILLFLFSYSASILLFFVNSRYRMPLMPFIMVLAGAGAVWLFESARAREVRSIAWGLVVLAASAFFVNFDFYGTHVGDRPQTHLTIGMAYAGSGEHERAIAEYEAAIELSPGYGKAWNNMGLEFEALGRDDDARAAYIKAIEADARLATARNNLGAMHQRRGELDEAARRFGEALEIDPWMHEAHYNLAAVLAMRGDLEGAERHLTDATISNPRFKEAWLALGTLMEDSGRVAGAIGAYQRAVIIDPDFAQARNSLGVALATTGQYEEALMEFEEALRCSPGDRNAMKNRQLVLDLIRARAARRGGSGG